MVREGKGLVSKLVRLFRFRVIRLGELEWVGLG
jgi:hypothetical protein